MKVKILVLVALLSLFAAMAQAKDPVKPKAAPKAKKEAKKPFGGENLLSDKWRDWHHNVLSRYAAADAGFGSNNKNWTGEKEDNIGTAAEEIAWHADFIDSYAYNPLYWSAGGPARIVKSITMHDELIKLHFDDLSSTEQVRYMFYQYTSGTITGLLWAKDLYDKAGGDDRKKKQAIGAARHVLGISLHAMQDFYSHSSWVNDPARREKTWFNEFTDTPTTLFTSQVYTGAYEKPDRLTVHSHGILSPQMSMMNTIAPLMDAMSSSFSPVHDMPICETWRRHRNNIAPVQPGIIPSPSIDGGFLTQMLQVDQWGYPRPLATELSTLYAQPSRTLIGLPPGLLLVAPPGIALDATYLRHIAVKQRGLVTDSTPPDVASKLADEVFLAAYRNAYQGSFQWLKRVDATMTRMGAQNMPGMVSFWNAVKNDAATGTQIEQFEDPNLQGYQFVSAGTYPPDANTCTADFQRGRNGQPAEKCYLRVKIDTGTDVGAGTDADIILYADGNTSKPYLLDKGAARDKGVLEQIISYNDFENGSSDTYLVGPFDRMPTSITLKNDAADAGRVFEAFGRSIDATFDSLRIGLASIFGGAADFVGENKKVWTWNELKNIGTSPVSFMIPVDGGDEGKYEVYGTIKQLAENGPYVNYNIQLTRLKCITESAVDQVKLGYPGDEPFLLVALSPLPGNTQSGKTGIFLAAHNNTEGPLNRPNTSDRVPFLHDIMGLGENRTGQIYFDYTVAVPKEYGALVLPVCVMESDDENEANRVKMLNDFVGKVDGKKPNVSAEIGSTLMAEWQIKRIEVTAFYKGGQTAIGNVLTTAPNKWLKGGESATYSLAASSSLLEFCPDTSELQQLIPALRQKPPTPLQKGMKAEKLEKLEKLNGVILGGDNKPIKALPPPPKP
jgi:hypothetical protein